MGGHQYYKISMNVCKEEEKNAFVLFCSDGNCIHMVDNGIVEKLMDLLDRHVEDGNVTVQHAALSALRNLAIPGKTRMGSNCVRRNKIYHLGKTFT